MKKIIVSVLSLAVLVSSGAALASVQTPPKPKEPEKVALCVRGEGEGSWSVREVDADKVAWYTAHGATAYDGLLKPEDKSAYLACGNSIDKQVKDVTTGSAYVEANDTTSALAVNFGDTLTYKIHVDGNVKNLELDDLLPAGVTPTNPTQAHIDAPAADGYVYVTVTVTAKSGFIANTACLNLEQVILRDTQVKGDEKTDANDILIKCDSAVVSVTVPATPSPSPSVSPTPTPTPVVTTTVVTLPAVGGSGRTRP